MEILHLKDWIQYIIFWIYIYICPWTNVLDITKTMSMDGTVLDIPSMDIVPSHYQHWVQAVQAKVIFITIQWIWTKWKSVIVLVMNKNLIFLLRNQKNPKENLILIHW